MNDYGAFVPGPQARLAPLASGPLDGLSFVAKDLIDVAGYVTGGGNPDWASARSPRSRPRWPSIACCAPARACRQGVTDELAFSLEGENDHHGTPTNPRAPDRLPGGSSSGSAVAVAGGLADLGLGTDTGGSVRVPASFCGLFGWRPSHGRVSMEGVVRFAPSYDTVGLLARDAARLSLCALPARQRPPASPARRLLRAPTPSHWPSPRRRPSLSDAAKALGALEEVEVFAGRPADFLDAYVTLQGLDIVTRAQRFP